MTQIPEIPIPPAAMYRAKPVIGNMVIGCSVFTSANNDIGLAADTFYALPFWVPWIDGVTLDECWIDISANGFGGSELRIGMYDDDNGEPGDRVYGSDAFDCSSIATIGQTISTPLVLGTGLYWLCFLTNSPSWAAAASASPAYRSLGVPDEQPDADEAMFYYIAQTYGAMPSSAPEGSWNYDGFLSFIPRVAFRRSA